MWAILSFKPSILKKVNFQEFEIAPLKILQIFFRIKSLNNCAITYFKFDFNIEWLPRRTFRIEFYFEPIQTIPNHSKSVSDPISSKFSIHLNLNWMVKYESKWFWARIHSDCTYGLKRIERGFELNFKTCFGYIRINWDWIVYIFRNDSDWFGMKSYLKLSTGCRIINESLLILVENWTIFKIEGLNFMKF